MHELAIAESIADIALRHADGRRVVKVELRVGALRQVVPDSLLFAFSALTPGTALDGAEIAITHVPVAGRCRACGAEGEMSELPLRCAVCASVDVQLLAGEELLIEGIEVEDTLVAD